MQDMLGKREKGFPPLVIDIVVDVVDETLFSICYQHVKLCLQWQACS